MPTQAENIANVWLPCGEVFFIMILYPSLQTIQSLEGVPYSPASLPSAVHRYPEIDKSIFASLWVMCREGKVQQLKEVLHSDRDILTYFKIRTLKGSTLIHEAVDAESPDIVQLLLLYGVNPDMRARGGLTPLHVAVSKCSVGCVRALIENGADISIRDELGQDAIAKAELRSKKREAVLKILRSKGKKLPYSGKFSREKTFAISQGIKAIHKNFLHKIWGHVPPTYDYF